MPSASFYVVFVTEYYCKHLPFTYDKIVLH